MKKILGCILITLCLSNMAYAKTKTVVGTISSFECGDNCYLTIIDKKGKEHHALCSDEVICQKMADNPEDSNLVGYKGKKVKVTVGKGKQFDGAGNLMGTMDAFEKIVILK